jgi:hypothetical protein
MTDRRTDNKPYAHAGKRKDALVSITGSFVPVAVDHLPDRIIKQISRK